MWRAPAAFFLLLLTLVIPPSGTSRTVKSSVRFSLVSLVDRKSEGRWHRTIT